MKRRQPERFKPVGPSENSASNPAWKRLLWFAGIALASGAVVAIVAYGLRGLLFI